MSEFIAHSRVRFKVAAFLAVASAVHFSSAEAQSPDSDSNLRLVRSLKSAVEAIESLPAFDVAGMTTYREDFGAVKQPVVQTSRFRMQLSHDREVLRYVVEIRYNRPRAAGNVKAGEPQTSSILITGNTVQRSNAVNGTEQYASVNEFQSFQAAIASGGAPPPGYWGLHNFPVYPDGLKSLYSQIEQIRSGNATVAITAEDDTIRYAAQFDEETGMRFSVVHWEFQLPTHLPTFHKIERATKGQLGTIREQHVDYMVIDGHEVPSVIRSWNLSVKREPKGFRQGKGRRVTYLKWLKIADDAVDATPQHLTTTEQIGSFLDEAPPTVPLDFDAP